MTTVFSIPIYSCPEKIFNKDYDRFLRKKAQTTIDIYSDFGRSEQEAIESIKKFYWKNGIWKYNQIKGFLEVNYHGGSFCFDAFLPEEKNTMRFSNKKKYLSLHEILGYYVQMSGDNQAIATNLILTVQTIAREYNFVLETSSFEIMCNCIDFKELKQRLK